MAFNFFAVFLALILAGCSSAPSSKMTPIPSSESPQPAPPPIARRVPPQTNAAPYTNIVRQPQIAPVPVENNPQFAATWIPLDAWCATNGFGNVARFATKNTAGFRIQSARGTLQLVVGSQLATWNGVEFWLGFAPQITAGRPFIHRLDIRKSLVPLLNPTVPLKNSGIVVIDPGHGGFKIGAQSVFNNRYEKEYTLDWANRLRDLLTEKGWKVYLTRTTDQHIEVSNRVVFAEKLKADIFISLHFNSSDHAEQSGLETYCSTPAGMGSSVTRGYEDDMNIVFPNNGFDTQNFQYAMRVHQSILHSTHLADRGVRRARFMGVLRNQRRPAIVVEGGYLSNPKEARLIANAAHRQKLAEAVARALTN